MPVTNSSGVATAAGAARNSRTSGVAIPSEPITTGRRPIRSATRPPSSVPTAPPARKTTSAVLPVPSEEPSTSTKYSGTNVSIP